MKAFMHYDVLLCLVGAAIDYMSACQACHCGMEMLG